MHESRQARTLEQLVREFQGIGLREGDNLILHSSFKSLGPVRGGPETVIDAILHALGPAGHLMVPTFTYSLPMWNLDPFDINLSMSRTGAITEMLRRRPDACRSFHPTHSVAIVGPDAEEITRNHLHATPTGLDSPFGRMHARGARILMLGTHQDTDSSLHYCEVVAKLPYLNVVFSHGQDYELAWFVNEKRQIEYTQLYEVPGCSRAFRVVETPLRERGVLRDVQVAAAPSQFLEMTDLVAAMSDILERNPSLLLCETSKCMICPKRRAYMRSLRATKEGNPV